MKKVLIVIILITAALLTADFPRPWEIVFYTNSTVAYSQVTIDGQPAAAGDEVGAFVAGECRGVGNITVSGNIAVSTMNIQGNMIEAVEFAVWDESEDMVCSVAYTTNTLPGGDIGYPPDLLPIQAISDPSQNLSPVWSLPDTVFWDEDTGYSMNLDDYVLDPEGEELMFSCLQQGELEVSLNGSSAAFAAQENYYGTNEIVFSASDGENTALDTMIAAVLPVNDPPLVFIAEDFSFAEDTELVIDLQNYVFDVDNEDLDIIISNNYYLNWSVTGMMLSITSEENWNGTENLQLTAFDGAAFDTDNFLVTVLPVNDAPVLSMPEVVSFPEDGQYSVNLDNYAFDPDGDDLSYTAVDSEILTLDIVDNILNISAPENFNGEEIVHLSATDSAGLSAVDSLLVLVTAVNDAPELDMPAEFTFDEDQSLLINMNDHAFDIDGDQLTVLVTGNSHINVQINDMQVILSAAANWWGSETLNFTVNDGAGRATAFSNAQIIVTAVNDAPVIDLPDNFSFYTYNELTEDFTDYVYDVDDDELSITAATATHIGIEISDLSVTFSTEPGWFGSETVSFTVSDGQLFADDSAIVEVLELGDLPDIILPQTIAMYEDIPLERDLGTYIFNSDGFDLQLSAEGQENIEVEIQDFVVTFTSLANWWGTEEITFVISDQEAGFSTMDSVLVEVAAVNDPPQIDLPGEVVFAEDSSFILDCEEFISDIDNDQFNLSVTGNQQILVNITELELEFHAAADYYGQETMMVTVNDNSGRAIAADSITVTITPVNDAPVLELPLELIFAEDTIYSLAIYEYLYDVDNDSLEIIIESDFDCLFDWQDEMVNILPPENYYGEGIIYVQADDGLQTVSDSLNVIIQPVNDAPELNLPDDFTFPEDTVFTFDIMDYAEDADGDNLLITYTGPFFIFVDINGSIVELEPLANWNDSVEMTFTVDDGSDTDTDEVLIVVEPVNDPPVLNSWLPAQTQLMYYGETEINFSVNVYDNDSELEYNWYINGELQAESDADFACNFTESAEYTVEVAINDEEYEINQQWQITIYGGPGWELVVYTNSTIAYSVVTIDGIPAAEDDLVGAFVDEECRGIGEIVVVDETAYSSFLIQGEVVEAVTFKVYSAADEAVYDVYYSTQTNPGGDLGNPPDDLLPLAAYTQPGPGWNVTEGYTQYTTVYAAITIDDAAAAAGDSLGAFDLQGECLGVCAVENNGDTALAEIAVYQDEAVDFNFRIWDADSNEIYQGMSIYQTIPGGTIGAPGAEILIDFNTSGEPDWEPVIYTNSTTGYFMVTINGEPAAEEDLLGVFVENECRGTGNIIHYENEALTTVEIQGEQVEDCGFLLWDASLQTVYEIDLLVQTLPGGEIGYPPDEIELDFWTYELPEFQIFPRPWTVLYYTNSTVAYGSLQIDGEPAAADDEVAAFVGSECRGTAAIINNGDNAIFTMNIQGDSPELVQFNYYDVSAAEIYSVEYMTLTNPGGDIGYPPNLLPLEIITNYPPQVNLPAGFSFNEDESAELDLSEYISDPDGDELTFEVTGNENIIIEIEGMMVTAYGWENWHGEETISYTVDDGHEHIVPGTLVLTVIEVNDPPQVMLPYSFTLQEDQSLDVDFSTFITDIEGDDWTLSVSGEEHIEILITGSMVHIEPEVNWNGEELVTFFADDGEDAGFDEIHLIVNSLPDAPVVDFPEQIMIYENGYLSLPIAEHIYDPDGDEFNVFAEGQDSITVVVSEDSISFYPAPDWYGTEFITVTADDGTMRLTGSDEIEVIVEFVHQPPELFLPDEFRFDEDHQQIVDLSPWFNVYEGDNFVFSAEGQDSLIIEFLAADMYIEVPQDYFGSETVVITLEDEPSRMAVADTVEIIIEPVNDPPQLISWYPEELNLQQYIIFDTTFTVDVLDVEGDVEYFWYINDQQQSETANELMYEFIDAGEYEVICIAADDSAEVSVTWQVTALQMDNDTDIIENVTMLKGNYPNPFNPETTISYYLQPEDLPAELLIYNSKGQLIYSWQLADSGSGSRIWQGIDKKGKLQPSGIYFYQLKSRNQSFTQKLLLLK